MTYDGLLSSLSKYARRDNSDPKENFITEAFAWVLRFDPDFADFFLKQISLRAKDNTYLPDFKVSEAELSTQYRLQGKIPDMVISNGNEAYVFEHKVDANLGDNQIQNYRAGAAKEWESKCCIVLITASKWQHDNQADIELTWADIYAVIDDWQEGRTKNSEDSFDPYDDFKDLLVHEGLGPPAPLSQQAMRSYIEAIHLEKSSISFFEYLKKDSKWAALLEELEPEADPFDTSATVRKYYGRIGIDLYPKDWSPNIFVGFLLDWSDHKMPPRNIDMGPDCVILLDFDRRHFGDYPENSYYKKLHDRLSKKYCAGQDWEFYSSLIDADNKDHNKWHPFCIRKPMFKVFEGSVPNATRASEAAVFDNQIELFFENVAPVLRTLLSGGEVTEIRNALSKTKGA